MVIDQLDPELLGQGRAARDVVQPDDRVGFHACYLLSNALLLSSDASLGFALFAGPYVHFAGGQTGQDRRQAAGPQVTFVIPCCLWLSRRQAFDLPNSNQQLQIARAKCMI